MDLFVCLFVCFLVNMVGVIDLIRYMLGGFVCLFVG
jgi:hypothetical protein